MACRHFPCVPDGCAVALRLIAQGPRLAFTCGITNGRQRPPAKEQEMPSTLRRNTHRTAAVTLLMAGMTASAFAGPVTRVKGNGAYLSVSGYDASGCIYSSLTAAKTGTNAAPQTFLYYDMYDLCAGQWIGSGNGYIPNSALKVGNKTATLAVTPSSTADFYTEGLTGPIRLTLKADGVESASFSGHWRAEFSGHTYQSHGAWTSKSAAVTGAIFGAAAESLIGSLGDSRDRYIEIDRGLN